MKNSKIITQATQNNLIPTKEIKSEVIQQIFDIAGNEKRLAQICLTGSEKGTKNYIISIDPQFKSINIVIQNSQTGKSKDLGDFSVSSNGEVKFTGESPYIPYLLRVLSTLGKSITPVNGAYLSPLDGHGEDVDHPTFYNYEKMDTPASRYLEMGKNKANSWEKLSDQMSDRKIPQFSFYYEGIKYDVSTNLTGRVSRLDIKRGDETVAKIPGFSNLRYDMVEISDGKTSFRKFNELLDKAIEVMPLSQPKNRN